MDGHCSLHCPLPFYSTPSNYSGYCFVFWKLNRNTLEKKNNFWLIYHISYHVYILKCVFFLWKMPFCVCMFILSWGCSSWGVISERNDCQSSFISSTQSDEWRWGGCCSAVTVCKDALWLCNTHTHTLVHVRTHPKPVQRDKFRSPTVVLHWSGKQRSSLIAVTRRLQSERCTVRGLL